MTDEDLWSHAVSEELRRRLDGNSQIRDAFRRLIDRNVVVRSIWHAWLCGLYPSFEVALIDMVRQMADQTDRLQAELIKAMQEQPIQVIMKPSRDRDEELVT